MPFAKQLEWLSWVHETAVEVLVVSQSHFSQSRLDSCKHEKCNTCQWHPWVSLRGWYSTVLSLWFHIMVPRKVWVASWIVLDFCPDKRNLEWTRNRIPCQCSTLVLVRPSSLHSNRKGMLLRDVWPPWMWWGLRQKFWDILRRSGVAKYRVSEQEDIGEHGCPLRFCEWIVYSETNSFRGIV